LVHEREAHRESQETAFTSVAAQIGCSDETVQKWIRHGARDVGMIGIDDR
jgi:hypothetical protein